MHAKCINGLLANFYRLFFTVISVGTKTSLRCKCCCAKLNWTHSLIKLEIRALGASFCEECKSEREKKNNNNRKKMYESFLVWSGWFGRLSVV